MRRASSGGNPESSVLFDARDIDSIGIVPASNVAAGGNAGRGSRIHNDTRWFTLTSANGAGALNAFSFTPRGIVARCIAGATGNAARAAPLWGVPFWRDITQFPYSYRPARLFTFSMCAMRVGVADASCSASIGIRRQLAPLSGSIAGGGQCGVEVVSIPSINGGNWTPRYQLTPMGAITEGSDSGIPGTNPIRVEIEYSEATPSIQVRINGFAFLSLSGIANMPTPSTVYPSDVGSSTIHMFSGFSSVTGAAVAGANYDEYWDARFRVMTMLDAA